MDDGRLERFLRTAFHSAGRQISEAKTAYRSARAAADADIPIDEDGNARLVCRRHADQRAVALDSEGRPSCFEAGHPDCEGCYEDIREGRIETW